MTGWYLAAAVVLLLANAFFVAIEFAFVTSRRERLEPLAAEGRRSATVALGSMRRLSLQLAGAQLGITMASLGLGFVAEPAVGHVLESWLGPIDLPDSVERGIAFAVALLVVTFLHLVIGEMVPKNLAIAGPERTVLALALPNRLYVTAFGPIIRFLDAVANRVVRLLGLDPKAELASAHTPEELAAILAQSRREGTIAGSQADLLSGALDLAERPVREVMVPRDRIVAVTLRTRMSDVERLVRERGHSRLPVLGRGLDDVVGFVHVKDLLRSTGGERDPISLRRLRRMLAVHQDTALADVLVRMQSSRLHLATVVDDEGGTAGLVSLEDVLESMVGDIRDESDRAAVERGSR
ncbi:MAG: HlyC/CorC family transporter [Acidimicrobiia bacterium]|nr:HlyC/CorC family transporter [Acidimicrobiia bacterium]